MKTQVQEDRSAEQHRRRSTRARRWGVENISASDRRMTWCQRGHACRFPSWQALRLRAQKKNGSSLTAELNSNAGVPQKFPKLPRKIPGLPQKFPRLRWWSAPFSGKPDTLSWLTKTSSEIYFVGSQAWLFQTTDNDCLQFLRGSALRALLRPFAPFCALLRTCVCALLRSFVPFCDHLRVAANDRVENDRVWGLQKNFWWNVSDHFASFLYDISFCRVHTKGSCNRTLLRRVLRSFSNSKCFLEGFLEGAW